MSDTPARRYREITISAIVFGVVVGAIMNAAITYSGLKIGFTIVGSAIAAVLGFGILRGVLRKGSILETNIGQTIASSVNTTNSGVIFTVPVLLLLGYSLDPTEPRFWLVTLACMAGAVMGAAFIIPLRKQMIDIERLRFPSGTAVGAILKSPGAGVTKTLLLLAGIVVAMAVYLPTVLPDLPGGSLRGYSVLDVRMARVVDEEATAAARAADPEAPEVLVERVDRDRDGQADLLVTDSTIDVGRAIGLPDSALLVFAIAPFALGAGYLSGKAGLMVLAGGVLAYLIVNPILFELGMLPGSLKGYQVSTGGWGREHIGKPLGIGLLLGGALMGVVVSLPSIGAALRSVASAKGARGGGSDELGLKTLGLAAVGAFCLLFLTAFLSSGEASNRFDPVTGATLVQAVGEESAAVAPPEGGFPTTVFRGYTLQFENAESLAQWEQMAPEDRDESLKRIRSRPGLLAGLPPVARALLIALIGTVWIWFSGIIIAQCTGMTDWSPISGIALLTVVLVMILAGVGAVIPAVLVGATLCCAITMSADMMADLRTGSIVGALPRRQQLAELATTWIGPVICMLTVLLIAAANMEKFGVPMGIGTETGAPQAEALKSVINGVQGGEMPYAMYGFGTLLGLLLGLGSFAGLGVLIGLSMYLPFIYISTYGIGCIINITLAKVKGRTWAEEWGVPFAAGLIVGEAILSLIINAIIVIAASMGGGAS